MEESLVLVPNNFIAIMPFTSVVVDLTSFKKARDGKGQQFRLPVTNFELEVSLKFYAVLCFISVYGT